jgi:hypothetical protein
MVADGPKEDGSDQKEEDVEDVDIGTKDSNENGELICHLTSSFFS